MTGRKPNVLQLRFSDDEINTILEGAEGTDVPVERRFSQSEDYYLQLTDPFSVPSLPIHHDVNSHKPVRAYLTGLRYVVRELAERLPSWFHGLRHVFTGRDVLRPAFYYLQSFGDAMYLLLLRIDLTYDPMRHEAEERTTNDLTPRYRTDRLPVEADIVPLTDVHEADPYGYLAIEQSVSETWIGESGRGYFVQGMWLDRELSKFFTKLFLPPGKRIHPYYPVSCKYRSVTHALLDFGANARREGARFLHEARCFLLPYLRDIEASLHDDDFSEELPRFRHIRSQVPTHLTERFRSLRVKPFLNEQEMREFVVLDEN